jgi:O-antigen/teichoic acid export membrane protein
MLRNSIWALLGQMARILLQALLFFVLARGLGVAEFGLYMTLFSVSQLIYPLIGFGTHNHMIMELARNPDRLHTYLGTPFILTIASGCVIALALSGFTSQFIHVSPIVLISILLTELLAYRLLDIATHVWQAQENLRAYAAAYTTLSCGRLLAAFGLLACNSLQLQPWAMVNFIVTLFIAIWTLIHLYRSQGLNWRTWRYEVATARGSIHFSFSGIAQNTYLNADKLFIAKLLGHEAVGLYSVAQRFVVMAMLPVQAILQASYARFFQVGAAGFRYALAQSNRMAPLLMTYSLAAAGLLYFLSPTLPVIFGKDYETSTSLLRLIAILPCLQTINYLLAEAMTGSGWQWLRSSLFIGSAIVGCALIWSGIQHAGLAGAASALTITEIITLFIYIAGAFFIFLKDGKK